MSKPFFTVIVPVFNAERYIRQCIDSIICQHYANFELLLIDDGSTDSSGRICEEYAQRDARVKVFHKQNGGVSSARNLGLDIASGEWISFVDSDDWVDSSYFETINNYVGQVDLLFFANTRHFVDGSTTIQLYKHVDASSKDYIEKEILQIKTNQSRYEYWGFTWNKCFKKAIIDACGIRFVESLSYREDHVFTDEYSRHCNSLKFIPISIYNYRETKYGLTFKDRTQEEFLLMCRKDRMATEGRTNVELIYYEQNWIMCQYFLHINRFHCSVFEEIYSLYKHQKNVFDKRKYKVLFGYGRFLSLIFFSLFIMQKQLRKK